MTSAAQGGRKPARGYAITVAFDLVEGAADAFFTLISANAAASVRLEPDCWRFDVLTPSTAGSGPDVFLYEIYRDRAAFDEHLASEHYKTFDAASRDLVRRKTVHAFLVEENAKTR